MRSCRLVSIEKVYVNSNVKAEKVGTEKNDLMCRLFVLVVVLLVLLPVLMWGLWGGGYMHGMTGMMGYGWWFTPLILLAFLVLLALGAYHLIKEFAKPDKSAGPWRRISRDTQGAIRTGRDHKGKILEDERRAGNLIRKRLTLGIVLVSIGVIGLPMFGISRYSNKGKKHISDATEHEKVKDFILHFPFYLVVSY
jgi:uncharacterized membrane protein